MEEDKYIKVYTTRLSQASSDGIKALKFMVFKRTGHDPTMNDVINFAVRLCAENEEFTPEQMKLFKIIK